MNKIIGLVGGASGRELTEQIHRRGYEVALICGQEKENGIELADYKIVTDLRNHDEIYGFLLEHNCKQIILGTGHRFAFDLGEMLEKNGMELNINIKASKLAKEKRMFKDFISNIGFNTPAYFSISNEEVEVNLDAVIQIVGLPCVVKATIDTMLPQKANSKASMAQAIRDVLDSKSPVIVEQFIRGIDLTVFVSVAKGVAKALPICYYSKAEDNDMKGFSDDEYIKGHLEPNAETQVMKLCEDLVLACGFEGLPRVDLMVIPDGPAYILETNSVGVTGINERHNAYCKGTVLALRKKGIDVAEVAVDTAFKKFDLL